MNSCLIGKILEEVDHINQYTKNGQVTNYNIIKFDQIRILFVKEWYGNDSCK